MTGLTYSSKGLKIGIILVLMISLALPISILTPQSHDERMNHLPSELIAFSSEVPRLNLTYYTLSDPICRPISNDSAIGGHHVIIIAEWTQTLVNHSRLQVYAPAIPASLVEEDLNSSIIEIDTHQLGNNATCSIVSTAWDANGSIYIETLLNVHIGNFFVPEVVVTSPNGGETWTGINNITWTASDVNENDTLSFEVLVSSDAGATFSQVGKFIVDYWFEWNSTGLDKLDTYRVEVRVTDGIYFASDTSDSNFTAGDIGHTTTTTTITTTTTTTTGTNTTTNGTTTMMDPRLTAFLVILVLSSSMMAIVVYYAARKWF
ncbi:MAG: hypothetical protein RTV72_14990 [Candidatus Thorarchaeota archaeon]